MTKQNKWEELKLNVKLNDINKFYNVRGNIEISKEELYDLIENTLKSQANEIISYIGSKEGWEETEDIYREHYKLNKKYI